VTSSVRRLGECNPLPPRRARCRGPGCLQRGYHWLHGAAGGARGCFCKRTCTRAQGKDPHARRVHGSADRPTRPHSARTHREDALRDVLAQHLRESLRRELRHCVLKSQRSFYGAAEQWQGGARGCRGRSRWAAGRRAPAVHAEVVVREELPARGRERGVRCVRRWGRGHVLVQEGREGRVRDAVLLEERQPGGLRATQRSAGRGGWGREGGAAGGSLTRSLCPPPLPRPPVAAGRASRGAARRGVRDPVHGGDRRGS